MFCRCLYSRKSKHNKGGAHLVNSGVPSFPGNGRLDMARLARKAPSLCTDSPLDHSDVCRKLAALGRLCRSCLGPTARLKQVHNNAGGPVTTTSTSRVLFQAAPPSHPLLKLLAASVLGHVSRFGDCGLFTAVLCLALLDGAKRSGLGADVAAGVYRRLLDDCTAYLHRDECGCKVKLDFSSSRNLITLARSVISSKPACNLMEREASHVGTLAVRAFVLTVPCDAPGNVSLGRVVTVSVEGLPVMDSAVFPGLLVEMPDAGDLPDRRGAQADPLKAVLFTVSLSGDSFESNEGTLEVSHGADPESEILDRLLELGRQVVDDGVTLFVCQKVIHPVLQHYLNRHGTVVIERLGGALVEPLTQLTGCQPLATWPTTIPPDAYGRVKSLCVLRFGPKRMLHLLPPAEAVVCSVVICHRNETMLAELKVAFQTAGHVLRLTLREPSALLGAGCTETHLAAYVRNEGVNKTTEVSSSLGCSPAEFRLGLEAFCRSLESAAQALQHDGANSLVDLTHGHHWALPAGATRAAGEKALGRCGCGLTGGSVSREAGWSFLNTEYAAFSPAPVAGNPALQARVLDSFTAKINALQVAVETANLLLDIRYIIQDVN